MSFSGMAGKIKTINKKKCKVAVLDMGEKLTGRHPLQLEGARKIWESAMDGNKVTQDEKNSIDHIIENHDSTDEAKEFFKFWLTEDEVNKCTGGEFEKIDNVKCDKAMIKVVDIFKSRSAGSALSIRAAEGVWFSALDGKGVTKTEMDTLGVISRNYTFDVSAKEFLENKMQWLGIAVKAAEAPAPGERVTVKPDAIVLKILDIVALADKEAPTDSAPPPNPFADVLALVDPAAPTSSTPTPTHPPGGTGGNVLQDVPSPSQKLQSDDQRKGGGGDRMCPLRICPLRDVPSQSQKLQLDVVAGQATSASSKRTSPEGVLAVPDEQPAKKPKRPDVSPIKLQDLREIFEKCDKDNSGEVSKIEMIKACRSDPEIAKFFRLPEHIRQEDGSRTMMEERFQAMDNDSSREISWAELLAFYKHAVVDM